MLRGLWKLTWLEIKIFVREPLGLFGTVGIPVLLFVALGRLFSGDVASGRRSVELDLPVFSSLLISLNAVLSLVTVIAIYREGGILKRLRATPLRPHVILTAHVVVKLLMTAATLVLTILIGARVLPDRPRRQHRRLWSRVPVRHHQRSLDRLRDREHRPDRAVCSAGRLAPPVSDGGAVGALRAGRIAAGDTTRHGAADSSHVCRVPPQGCLEGRLVGGPYG